MQNSSHFITRDLYLASFFILNKQPLLALRKENSIVYFQFEKKPITEKLVIDFFSGAAKVDPICYVENLKRLRRLINSYGK
jgi:hypothetical protein